MVNSLDVMTFDELRETRIDAISNWNGPNYKTICDLLGLEPDIPELYEQGEAEKIYLGRKASEYEDSRMREFERNKLKTPPIKEAVQKRYETFSNLWLNSRIDEKNFATYTNEKRKALLIFPRFQKNHIQDIERYDDLQIGKLYQKMIDYSKKRIDKI